VRPRPLAFRVAPLACDFLEVFELQGRQVLRRGNHGAEILEDRLFLETGLGLVERQGKILPPLKPVPRVLRESLGQNRVELRRDVLRHVRDRGEILVDDLVGDRRQVLAGEGFPVRQHLVEDDPERKDVAPAVHGSAGHLLRGHVVRRAEELARRRQIRGGDLGDAEVRDLHLAVGGDHDVRRLDVAVDDPFPVGVVERLGDLPNDVGDLIGRELAPVDHETLERLSLDVLHGDERHATVLVLADVVDRDDVRVRENPRRLGLAHEALAELPRLRVVFVDRPRANRLDRDEPSDGRVLGEIDDAHRALAELAQNLEPAETTQLRDVVDAFTHRRCLAAFPKGYGILRGADNRVNAAVAP
jgi:hypothetical protein